MKKFILCGDTLRINAGGGVAPRAADLEAIRLCHTERPRVLVITAGPSADELAVAVRQLYAGELDCNVERLPTSGEALHAAELQRRLEATDLIYLDGTDTLALMRFLRNANLDTLLRAAVANQKMLLAAGAGAGACFAYGLATLDDRPGELTYLRVRGLGLLDCLGCPGGENRGRLEALKNIIGLYRGLGLALASEAQLCVIGDQYQTLGGAGRSGLQHVYRIGEQVIVESVAWHRERQPLSVLLTRPTELPPQPLESPVERLY